MANGLSGDGPSLEVQSTERPGDHASSPQQPFCTLRSLDIWASEHGDTYCHQSRPSSPLLPQATRPVDKGGWSGKGKAGVYQQVGAESDAATASLEPSLATQPSPGCLFPPGLCAHHKSPGFLDYDPGANWWGFPQHRQPQEMEGMKLTPLIWLLP